MRKLKGPQTYELYLSDKKCSVIAPSGEKHFIYPASKRIPKLYVISEKRYLLYVGISVQPLSNRIRYGLTATGKGGYHGYKWSQNEGVLRIDVWWAEKLPRDDLESIEAEVAYLYRKKSGQWPSHQNEIHFHKTNRYHREAAEIILKELYK